MIELHPKQMARMSRRQTLAGRGNAFAMTTMLRRGRPVWAMPRGCFLLIRWSGDRWPLPSFATGAVRQAIIAGRAGPEDGEIAEFPGLEHLASTIYHFAAVPVSGGGVLGPINPWAVQSRVFNGSGTAVGLMPNAPGAMGARLLPGRKPLVRWAYSAFGQQAAASTSRVFAAVGDDPWNFGTAVAEVAFISGRTMYEWVGEPLEPGDVVHYVVRTASAAGVLSLIPRLAGGPGPSYTDVDKSRVPVVSVPAGAPSPPAYLASETR